MFRDWRLARADEKRVCRSTDDWESEAVNVAAARTVAIEERIFAELAAGLAHVGVKLVIATGFGDWESSDLPQVWEEARAMPRRLTASHTEGRSGADRL